jgi:uncharacterized C2H2 Zn-finger protein
MTPPQHEKRGTANWVRCPSCRAWFNVTAGLLARPQVRLHCPQCQTSFAQAEALRINRGG